MLPLNARHVEFLSYITETTAPPHTRVFQSQVSDAVSAGLSLRAGYHGRFLSQVQIPRDLSWGTEVPSKGFLGVLFSRVPDLICLTAP